jgi:predicted nucleotidyltransferase
MKSADVAVIVNAVADWARNCEDIRAMALVGSWARGNPHQGSDIDLMLLSDCADEYRHCPEWPTAIDFNGAGYRVASSEDASYGVVWSRHIALLPTGEVELTFAPRSWARTDAVNLGTRSVVTDAFQIIVDKDGAFAELVAAVMPVRA